MLAASIRPELDRDPRLGPHVLLPRSVSAHTLAGSFPNLVCDFGPYRAPDIRGDDGAVVTVSGRVTCGRFVAATQGTSHEMWAGVGEVVGGWIRENVPQGGFDDVAVWRDVEPLGRGRFGPFPDGSQGV